MPRMNRQLIVVVLVSVLGAAGCDITPEYPVLNGDRGPSSLSRSDEAFSPTREGAPAEPGLPLPPMIDDPGEAGQEHENAEHE